MLIFLFSICKPTSLSQFTLTCYCSMHFHMKGCKKLFLQVRHAMKLRVITLVSFYTQIYRLHQECIRSYYTLLVASWCSHITSLSLQTAASIYNCHHSHYYLHAFNHAQIPTAQTNLAQASLAVHERSNMLLHAGSARLL